MTRPEGERTSISSTIAEEGGTGGQRWSCRRGECWEIVMVEGQKTERKTVGRGRNQDSKGQGRLLDRESLGLARKCSG